MRHLRSIDLLALAATLLIVGCGTDDTSAGVEEGLLAFASALDARDAAQIWDRLSDDTQALCEDALASLRETERQIELLQPSDQIDARTATGVDALASVESAADLLAHILRADAIPSLDADGRYFAGLRPEAIIGVAEGVALVTTRAGQEIELVRDDVGQWRVREPMFGLIRHALSVTHTNRDRVVDAVRLFGVEGSVDEELRRLGLL